MIWKLNFNWHHLICLVILGTHIEICGQAKPRGIFHMNYLQVRILTPCVSFKSQPHGPSPSFQLDDNWFLYVIHCMLTEKLYMVGRFAKHAFDVFIQITDKMCLTRLGKGQNLMVSSPNNLSSRWISNHLSTWYSLDSC